jgi:hypothetical protein
MKYSFWDIGASTPVSQSGFPQVLVQLLKKKECLTLEIIICKIPLAFSILG